MPSKHILMLVVVFVVGYLAGVWKPSFGQSIVSKLQGS